MLRGVFDLGRSLLLTLEPERAHEAALRALEVGIYPRQTVADSPALATKVLGLDFPNPVGIAAGFDKNARVADAILAIGFGFAEIGTVTPRPQHGNPSPRVFRLIHDRGLINRLGFNNEGHGAALQRMKRRHSNGGIVGVNIGANKDSIDRVEDYLSGLATFYDVANYFTVNISSPNTPGLRDLQAPDALNDLLSKLMIARHDLTKRHGEKRPIIVKLAPDIASEDLPIITDLLMSHRVDGICVSNTTLARDNITEPRLEKQAGGVSGRPLFELSTRMLSDVYQLTNGQVPLIGVGGIDSPEAALTKIEAGASLLQLYTGLVFEGLGLIARIKQRLCDSVQEAGVGTVKDLVGRRADAWSTCSRGRASHNYRD